MDLADWCVDVRMSNTVSVRLRMVLEAPSRTPGLLMGLDGSDILDLTSVIPLTVVSS